MRFGFYVSGKASRFKRFIDFLVVNNQKAINDIALVFSDNVDDVELNRIAKIYQIRIEFFNSKSISRKNVNQVLSDSLLNSLKESGASHGFVFGSRILTGDILIEYKDKLINFHPSILPSFKGLKAIDQALEDKAFLLGNSAHILTKDLDGGPIIMQHLLHCSHFNGYDSVLDGQISMIYQIMLWINQSRLSVANGFAYIVDANYKIGNYVPNMELENIRIT